MITTTKKLAGLAAILAAGAFIIAIQPGKAEPQPAPIVATQPVGVPSAVVDLTQAAESSVNAVVYIKVVTNSKIQTQVVQDPFADMFGEFFGFGGGGQRRQIQTPKREASGSGVILSKDGYIVTNNHVVAGADEVEVRLNDSREFKARIIGTDEQTDLALLKIEGDNLPTLPIGNSDDLKLGQWVLAVGNPFNLTSTVTAGIISAKARSLGANSIESFIQTDAAINSGNSGGALVNERGELVGINAMLYSNTGSYSGYGFAIPTTIMNKVVADLKEYGIVQRAVLGVLGTDAIKYIDQLKAEGKDSDLGTMSGCYIDQVQPGSAAEEGGLRKGDIIISTDGKAITKWAEMAETFAKHRPGDKVSIKYIRDKKEYTTTVTLRNAEGNTRVIEQVDIDLFGAALRPLTDKVKIQLRLPYGLEIAALKRGKMQEAGATKGLIILQVNDRPMRTVEDFEDAVRIANQSGDRTLWIRAITPSGQKRSLVIDLNEK